ncbi:MAG TPA: hypothetical protein VMS60_15900 [Solirubrobacterales bacterium]|nr:hypothetical protein [Solirubrobacterales bacterium]
MKVKDGKVAIAKRDLFAEIPNGFGQEIKQLVAREGQEVPPSLAEYVDEDDVTTELAKTRSLIGSRSGAERRAGVEAEVEEPAHADVRAAAGVTEPVESTESTAPAGDEELAAENEQLREQLAEKASSEEAAEKAASTAQAELDAEKERSAEAIKEAEEKVTAAEQRADDAEKAREGENVKPSDAGASKAQTAPAKDKTRKSAPTKARKSAKKK